MPTLAVYRQGCAAPPRTTGFPGVPTEGTRPSRPSVSSRPNHHGDQPVTGRFRAGGIAARGVQPALRRSHGLPGLRQTSYHAQATFDDGSQVDAGAVPAALGVTILVPIGRPELCENKISPGEEVRAGPQGSGGTEEGRKKGCSEDGGMSVVCSHPVSSPAKRLCPRAQDNG